MSETYLWVDGVIARSTPPWSPHWLVLDTQAASRHMTVRSAGAAPMEVVDSGRICAQPAVTAATTKTGIEMNRVLILTSDEDWTSAVKTAGDRGSERLSAYIDVGRQ